MQHKTTTTEEHKNLRSPRPDGEQTRSALLEIAGQMFAQKGYAAVSSKEICLAAGVNMASVNYHFLSKEGLYSAVLTEADDRVISQQELKTLFDADTAPEYKLEQIMLFVLRRIQQGADGWPFQVKIREMMSPSGVSGKLISQQLKPKLRLFRQLLGQILHLPSYHPKVQEALACCFSPGLLWLIGTPDLRKQLLPALERRTEQQAEHIVKFIIAGLAVYRQPEASDTTAKT